MSVRLAALVSLAGALALAGFASAPTAPALPGALGQGEYIDPRLGFKMFVPKTWTVLPLSLDERWMVAKFLSDKTYFYTEKGGGWTNEHKPDLQVIAFVADAMKEKLKVEKKEVEGGVTEWRIFLENPYKSYEDFLKSRYAGGGWFVSEKKEGTVNDIPVTQMEIKVEKLSMDGPKRIFTWIYHVPDVDIAVQYEVLENSIDKLKNEISRTHKSFKSIPRKGGPLYEVSTPADGSMWVDQDKLTKEERKAHRQGLEQKSHEKAGKTAPDGWKVQKMGRFLVMNHADEKFAKSVVDQCEAVWDWLDKTFPFVGEGEYVRSPLIRICANYEEYQGFFKGGSWFSRNDLEITTYQDFGGKTSYTMENVNRRVKDIWFKDRDVDLWTAMPGWLGIGLDDYVGRIHVGKNGVIEIGRDLDNTDDVRERLREGKMTPLKQLLTSGNEEFREWGRFAESGYLFGYFASGAGKSKRTKDLLPYYVKNLKEVALEVKKESAGKEGVSKTPKTEEEEDAMFKNQQQGFKAAERRLLDETFKRTFIGWTDDDWKKFQEAYEKSL